MKKLVQFAPLRVAAWALITSIVLSATSYCQDWKDSVITDPSISLKCQALIDKRADKIRVRQRLEGLIERNQKLQKKTPEQKVTVKKKLERNLKRLQNELSLTEMKIKAMTENVVRSGCPGITL